MRVIGSRIPYAVRSTPSAQALKAGAEHQGTAAALAAVRTTGVQKGIYRFRSHIEANAHADAAQIRAIAVNIRARNLVP